MLKELIRAYLQTRLNAIDKEIEELSEQLVCEEDKAKEKSVISQSIFEYSSPTKRRIAKLARRIMLYQLIFGEIK